MSEQQKIKIAYTIRNEEKEYLAWYDKNEYGSCFFWSLRPDAALRFENQESTELLIKWIDYPLKLQSVLLEFNGARWRPVSSFKPVRPCTLKGVGVA